MFKQKVLNVCPSTGFVEIEIQYIYWNNAPRTIKETYKTKPDAEKRIKHYKVEYVLFHLEQYVSACRNLMETGESYSTTGKKFALETCTNGIHYFQDKSLQTIARYMVKIQPMLLQLLPGESSSHYRNLHKIYIRLITFCQTEINLTEQTEICQDK